MWSYGQPKNVFMRDLSRLRSCLANRPPRLGQTFQEYQAPIWFVTFNTHKRAPLLANDAVHQRFRAFGCNAAKRETFVGRYVLMPDHIHLFVAGPANFDLPAWVRLLKLALSAVLPNPQPHWQEGFFDHLLRREESYADKWEYVRHNPVRAGLAHTADAWTYQGEMVPLAFA